jgi:PIN domain nuclease of toxin-antitoxin system
MTDRFLLDTCAVLWIVNGAQFGQQASAVLSVNRQRSGALNVSAMSAWEIGILITKGRLPTTKGAMTWFDEAIEMIDATVVDVSLPVLVTSSFLPQPIHNDPADRIIIATAREHDLTIITRDRAILAYGAAGHVKTLAC